MWTMTTNRRSREEMKIYLEKSVGGKERGGLWGTNFQSRFKILYKADSGIHGKMGGEKTRDLLREEGRKGV